MSKSLWPIIALLLAGAVAAVWWRAAPAPEPPPASSAGEQSLSSSDISTAANPEAGRDTAEPTAVAQTSATPPAEAAKPPLFVAGLEATLRADADGSLIMDAETLGALEMLTNMSPRELALRQQRLVEQLPPVAASQALDLLPKVAQYRAAAKQLLPPGTVPTTVPEALDILDAMHRLRVSYLGEDAARSFFARDEAIARKFIESAGAAPQAERTAAEQSQRTEATLRMAFSFFIMPRTPPKAIGQQDGND